MANKKTNYSKPSRRSIGLRYQVRFDFGKKAFFIFNGKKIIGDKQYKNVDEAIIDIKENKI